jgi:formamidopyrimidine-DNA glycosylase
MPEGDTIAYAAGRMRPVLEGHVPEELRTPHPRHRLDRQVLKIIELVRPRMLRSAQLGPRAIVPRVYGLAGRPCPRCGRAILSRGQGDENRTTYWCRGCQT